MRTGLDAAMTNTIEDDHPPLDLTLADRRRPGRRDSPNPNLIALLRGQSHIIDPANVEAARTAESGDDLAAARGVVFGVSIGTAMWAVIIVAIWSFT